MPAPSSPPPTAPPASRTAPPLFEAAVAAHEVEWLTRFRPNRMAWASASDPLVNGYWWMFLTKPDLNLSRTPDGTDGPSPHVALDLDNARDSELIRNSLSWSLEPSNPFIHVCTNRCVAAPLADVVGEHYQAYQNYVANGFNLGGHTTASRSMQDLTVSYQELERLPIIRMHDVWVRYIDMAVQGLVARSERNRDRRVLDYAASIYVFHVKPDGASINTWAKYTGVFPTAVPWSALQSDIGAVDAVRVEIPYAYTWYEANDSDILRDFNTVSSGRVGGPGETEQDFYSGRKAPDGTDRAEAALPMWRPEVPRGPESLQDERDDGLAPARTSNLRRADREDGMFSVARSARVARRNEADPGGGRSDRYVLEFHG